MTRYYWRTAKTQNSIMRGPHLPNVTQWHAQCPPERKFRSTKWRIRNLQICKSILRFKNSQSNIRKPMNPHVPIDSEIPRFTYADLSGENIINSCSFQQVQQDIHRYSQFGTNHGHMYKSADPRIRKKRNRRGLITAWDSTDHTMNTLE